MRSPHLTSSWPPLLSPFTQKMSEVLFLSPFNSLQKNSLTSPDCIHVDHRAAWWQCWHAFQQPTVGRGYLRAADGSSLCTDSDGVITHVGRYANNGRFLLVLRECVETGQCAGKCFMLPTFKGLWQRMKNFSVTTVVSKA